MYKFHKTADGRKVLIVQMSDEHLLNTIKMYCRKFREFTSQSEGFDKFLETDPYAKFLVDTEECNTKEEIAYRLTAMFEKLAYLVSEGVLRPNISAAVCIEMQSTFHRETEQYFDVLPEENEQTSD